MAMVFYDKAIDHDALRAAMAAHPEDDLRVCRLDAENREDGPYRVYRKGKERHFLKETGIMRRGLPHGRMRRYASNGDILEEVHYKKGLRHGPAFRRSLDKGRNEFFIGKQRSGLERKEIEENYVEGKRDGAYHEKTTLEIVEALRVPSEEGFKLEEFVTESVSILTGQYKNNERFGEWHYEGFNGEKQVQRYNEKGQPDGEWMTTYRDGRQRKENFSNGRLHGLLEEVTPDGYHVFQYYEDGRINQMKTEFINSYYETTRRIDWVRFVFKKDPLSTEERRERQAQNARFFGEPEKLADLVLHAAQRGELKPD